MKKAIFLIVFGAFFALSANSQTSTLTDSEVKQVTDEVAAHTGIIINFDDLLRAGGVLITTYGTTLPDKVVEVKLADLVVIVYLKD